MPNRMPNRKQITKEIKRTFSEITEFDEEYLIEFSLVIFLETLYSLSNKYIFFQSYQVENLTA